MRTHIYAPFSGPNAELAYAVLAAERRAGIANANISRALERSGPGEIKLAWALYDEAERVARELRKELIRQARTCGETPGGRWWDGEEWRRCTLPPGHGTRTPHRFEREGATRAEAVDAQLDVRFA
jgi:hypothetical protein